MSKQKHDQGFKKRRLSTAPVTKERTTEHLASELVRKRLASNLILDRGQNIGASNRRER
ncbi:hypothetical protein ACIQCM_08770 [Pseudarthrobacter sp. NPDC092439]|uniref:hypothetical protein n=1 Tax=unclassified Pseudarthrobacter TaxID=2647000 RepID=UPI003825A559